jgi:Protein of unknown function (DUF4242)
VAEFLVELYISRADAHGIRQAAEAFGTTVSCVRSIFVPEDELCFLLVEAASADDVRDAARTAGLRFERISEVATPPEPTIVTDG